MSHMSAEERLNRRREAWEGRTPLDEVEAQLSRIPRLSETRMIRVTERGSMWATLRPEDIELIADLVVERSKEGGDM